MIKNKNILSEIQILIEELKKIDNKIDIAIENQNQRIDKIEESISSIKNELINIDTNSLSYLIDDKFKKFEFVNPEYMLLKDKNKKNILLCGFYGAYNLGDELMLETLLDYLSEFKNISLTIMLCNNSQYDISRYPNITFIHYPQTVFDFSYLSDYYDMVIFGGGALISDIDYDNNIINEVPLTRTLVELTKMMISKKKKCLWLGLSSNKEFYNKNFIKELKFIIENNEWIYFRDQFSVDSIANIGIDTSNIKLIDDIIFANKYLLTNKTNSKNERKQIGVILICIDDLKYKNIEIIKMIDSHYSKIIKNYDINLIPFYDYNKNDYIRLNEYKNEVKNDNIKVLEYTNSMKEIVNTINSQDYVISMRYHGALLSMILKKPLLTILFDQHKHYDNKIKYINQKYCSSKNIVDYSKIDKSIFNKKLDELDNNNSFKDNQRCLEESQKEIKGILNSFIKE